MLAKLIAPLPLLVKVVLAPKVTAPVKVCAPLELIFAAIFEVPETLKLVIPLTAPLNTPAPVIA